jgi:hypothetical protein
MSKPNTSAPTKSETGVLPGTPAGEPAKGPGIVPGTPDDTREQGKPTTGRRP